MKNAITTAAMSVLLFIFGCGTSTQQAEETSDSAEVTTEQEEVVAQEVTFEEEGEAVELGEALTIEELKKATFSGSEPFWSIKFTDEYLLYEDPSGPLKVYFRKSYDDATKIKLKEAYAVKDKKGTFFATMNEEVTLQIMVTRQSCSDGMSEDEGKYKMVILYNKDAKNYGCGNPK
jgi:uncharacterized membrane protein